MALQTVRKANMNYTGNMSKTGEKAEEQTSRVIHP